MFKWLGAFKICSTYYLDNEESLITYAIFYVQVPLWLKFLQFLWWWINHSLHISTIFQIIVIIILVSSVCFIKFLQFLLIKHQNQRFYKSKEPVSEVPSNTKNVSELDQKFHQNLKKFHNWDWRFLFKLKNQTTLVKATH